MERPFFILKCSITDSSTRFEKSVVFNYNPHDGATGLLSDESFEFFFKKKSHVKGLLEAFSQETERTKQKKIEFTDQLKNYCEDVTADSESHLLDGVFRRYIARPPLLVLLFQRN